MGQWGSEDHPGAQDTKATAWMQAPPLRALQSEGLSHSAREDRHQQGAGRGGRNMESAVREGNENASYGVLFVLLSIY